MFKNVYYDFVLQNGSDVGLFEIKSGKYYERHTSPDNVMGGFTGHDEKSQIVS